MRICPPSMVEGVGALGSRAPSASIAGPGGLQPLGRANFSTRIEAAAQSSRSATGELAIASSSPLTRAVQPCPSQRNALRLRDLGLRPAVAVVLQPARQLEVGAATRQRGQARPSPCARRRERRRARSARPACGPWAPASARERWAPRPAAASACSTARTTARRRSSARRHTSGWPARDPRRPAGSRPSWRTTPSPRCPSPSPSSGAASSPNGIATSVASAAGMTTILQIGMAIRLARIANCCVLWKW